jgi:hypothetical protein
MFIIRSAFWIALIIALIPSDPSQQAKMYQTASYAVHRAATFCDRNVAVCDSANAYWGLFKEKAAVGARMLGDLVNERLTAPPAPDRAPQVGPREMTPVLERSAPSSETLRPSDRAPDWRSRARAQL